MKTTPNTAVQNDLATRPDDVCCICAASPALRKVGKRGYCKKHLAEATADRAHFNDLIADGEMPRRHTGFNKAHEALSNVISASIKRGQK